MKPLKTHKYKVGDKVWVVNPGYTYPTFAGMFKVLGFRNTTENPSFEIWTCADIWCTTAHDGTKTNTPLYGIRNAQGEESLISERGITLYPAPFRRNLAGTAVYPDLSLCEVYSHFPRWNPNTREVTVYPSDIPAAMRTSVVTPASSTSRIVVRVHNEQTDGYTDYMHYNGDYVDFTYDTRLRIVY